MMKADKTQQKSPKTEALPAVAATLTDRQEQQVVEMEQRLAKVGERLAPLQAALAAGGQWTNHPYGWGIAREGVWLWLPPEPKRL